MAIASMDVLQAALGLEVYRQKRGEYPERLEGLGAINWAVPKDPCSGNELVYRREGARFVLYSVGLDLKDDDGEPIAWLVRSSSRPKTEMTSVHGVSVDSGDIPWMSWEETTAEAES